MSISNLETDMDLLFSSIPRGDCPLCGAQGPLIHENLKDVLYGAPGEWGFRSCPNEGCGLIWQDPMPHAKDLALAYANYYTQKTTADLHEKGIMVPGGWLGREYLAQQFGYPFANTRLAKLRLSRLLPLFPRLMAGLDDFVGHLSYQPGGNLLEIGCGNGAFMQSMRAMGWKVTGVETDRRSAAIALAAGLEVHQGDLSDIALPDSHFSAIVMRHVVEHLPNPVETLTRCCSLLRPGGQLVITTPNPQGLGHRIFGSAWRGLEPPRHLQLFGLVSMQVCLERAGFTGISSRATVHWVDGILRQSVLIRLPALRRNIVGKIVAAAIGAMIAQVELALGVLSDTYGEELRTTAVRPP